MEKLLNQSRLDWYEDAIDYETSPVEKTPEGFLIARAPLTSVGVFTYKNDDGSPRRELRPPEEVFKAESLATLRMKPLTLLHPDEKVTPQNVKELSVGSIGTDISNDSYRVYGTVAVTKADAVGGVEDGSARALSCGYNCDIEWQSGTWMGVPYDCIQRNIRYNHVALVPVPRAGDGNAIRMDAGEPTPRNLYKQPNPNEENMDLKTYHIDGADYKAEPQVIAALDKAVARADAAEKERDQLRADCKANAEGKAKAEGERDSFKERLDAMEKEMPGKIAAGIKARLELVSKATTAGVEVRDDMADADIKKAVILKHFPNAHLDGAEDAYINARFDCAVENAMKEAEDQSRRDAAETTTPHNVTPSAEEMLATAKANYNKRLDSGWQDNH